MPNSEVFFYKGKAYKKVVQEVEVLGCRHCIVLKNDVLCDVLRRYCGGLYTHLIAAEINEASCASNIVYVT